MATKKSVKCMKCGKRIRLKPYHVLGPMFIGMTCRKCVDKQRKDSDAS